MNRLLFISLLTLFYSSLSAQERTIGVVTIDKYVEGDSLVFYSNEENEWLKFDPFYREDESSFSMPSNFQPLAFHPDYFLLVLRVKQIEDDFATVITNESQNSYSMVNLTSKTLKYLEWEVFFESIYAVDLSNENNVYRKPESDLKINFDQNAYIEFKPIKVLDDWLEINWTNENETHTGWVKWRDKEDNLLIDLHYYN